MIDVVMPQLGESVAEGTVTKWLVREGDYVTRDQVLLEVATDKADTEVLAPANGVVTAVAAAAGSVVPKQGLLCRIDDSAAKSAPAPDSQKSAQKSAPPAASNGELAATPLTSPSTRKLAREMGVDLQRVQPTGEHGRVTHDDVVHAVVQPLAAVQMGGDPPYPPAQPEAKAPPIAPLVLAPAPAAPPTSLASPAVELSHLIQAGGGFVPPIPGVGFGAYKVPPYVPRPGDQVIPFNRRRRITADHMAYSKVTSPHVVTVAEVDLQATSKLRDEHKDRYKKAGVPLTFLTFVCAATIKALNEHPGVNARVLDGAYVLLRDINLGIAVDTPGGLIVPSIKHADQLSLRGVAATIDELAGRARSGKITADDLSNTTFTVSNPGLKGNLFGGAIISQPNVGILRMGEIKKRAVVVTRDGEDSIAIHPVMFMALSYDHRIIDGVLANSFLWRVADVLTRAEFEVT
jgi:2-oxoglutarate dehydrogenase E2 component (dihydrolipoamide succinyltransferase)